MGLRPIQADEKLDITTVFSALRYQLPNQSRLRKLGLSRDRQGSGNAKDGVTELCMLTGFPHCPLAVGLSIEW